LTSLEEYDKVNPCRRQNSSRWKPSR